MRLPHAFGSIMSSISEVVSAAQANFRQLELEVDRLDAADATLLKLDASNDPVTGPLTIDTGAATNELRLVTDDGFESKVTFYEDGTEKWAMGKGSSSDDFYLYNDVSAATCFNVSDTTNIVDFNERPTHDGLQLAVVPCAAAIYLANSGAPTHTSDGGWQHMGAGGGTDTWTADYDVRDAGLDAQCDTTSDTAKLTCRKAGIYAVSLSAYLSSMASGSVFGAAIYLNGARATTQVTNSAAGTVSGQVQVGAIMNLAVDDTLEPYVFQNDTASEGYVVSDKNYNNLSMVYLSPAA